jgi:Rrf2 family protein
MALISSRSRYGLRLLIDLAERAGEGPVDLGTIAQRQEIPEQYLAKLVATLKAAGLLRSERGSKGGYELARSAAQIDLLTVVETLEGRGSLTECAVSPESCSRSPACRSFPIWRGLDKVIKNYLRALTVADAARGDSSDYNI